MPAARIAAAGAPAYLHIAFPNDPTLMSVARTYRNYLRAKALPGEMQRPSHFHITLLYLSAATDEQVDALFEGVGLPLAFRPEFVRPSLLKSTLVLLVDPEPGLIGVQRTLWHRAQAVGCGMDEAGYSNPESYLPHVSLINDMNRAFDVADLPKHPALPFHLSASRIVIGREDYDAVRSVRMPASAGDRVLIEKGGPWVWPTEPRLALPLEQAKALLRGEVVVHRRRIFTLGEPLVILGGPGSGHFGHEGRPGEVGGSAPHEGAAAVSQGDKQSVGQGEKEGDRTGEGYTRNDVNGVTVSVKDAMTEQKLTLEDVRAAIETVPEAFRARIPPIRLTDEFLIEDDGGVSTTAAASMVYEAAPEGSKSNMRTANEIVIWLPAGDTDSESFQGGLRHEVGHAVMPAGDDFKEQWQAAVESDGTSISDYAKMSTSEDFAETVRSLWSPDSAERRSIERFFPARFELLKQAGLT